MYGITSKAIKKMFYLAYWKEGSSGSNATSIKGDRGIRGKHGATVEAGSIAPHDPKGVKRRYRSVWMSCSQGR